MPDHTNGRLKSGEPDVRKEDRIYDTTDTFQSNQQKANMKKTGNSSHSSSSKTSNHEIFTDYDAIEHFNRVLLKKATKTNGSIHGTQQRNS
jgi:hypothetical protein